MATKSKEPAPPRSRGDRKQTDHSVADVLADFAAAYRLLDSGQLADYAGQQVALLQGEVVGAEADSASLRARVSKARRVSTERIAIIRGLDETTVSG